MCQVLDAELASVEHFLELDKINQVIKANSSEYWVGLELNISASWSWTDSSLLITEYLPVGSFGSCGAYETLGDSFISQNCDLNLPFICKKSGSMYRLVKLYYYFIISLSILRTKNISQSINSKTCEALKLREKSTYA